MAVFEARAEIAAPVAELYAWHARPGAFERLAPPWQRVRVLEASGGIEDGARLVMRVGRWPIAVRWIAVHRDHELGRRFVDVQESGPFRRWIHEHRFEDDGAGRSVLVDRVDYEAPLGRLGASFARGAIERLFAYRHAVTRADLERHAPFLGTQPLKVAVTGATGLVGSALCAFLTTGGHEVFRVVRGEARGARDIAWDIGSGTIEREKLEGLDAVVHLAGENIAAGRWTEARKARILESRTKGTRLLARTLASLASPPKIFLSASASGYYGPRGAEPVDETQPSGSGFLAAVCRAWEEATEPAARKGITTARLRFGVILSPKGGALAKMLLPFRLGLGGPVGSGKQGFPWIALDDVVYVIHHLIRKRISGTVNVVGPNAVSQAAFARVLGRVLHRPAFLPLPAVAVRAAFGQLGEDALLAGQFLVPRTLASSGFTWTLPDLEAALARDLGRVL
jgi:uncharacterized protein